ncbi:MAG: asparagine synthetase B, partial [Oscillospiraceae bacterium]|nr:asparagine synthetase B [Oscillospiraceae bacterium]
MCGIAGMIDFTQDLRTQEQIFKNMQQAIIRRGPDQNGMHITEHEAFLHTRLAVIDPEYGRQPMQYTDGTEIYTIIYNGELFNFSELREELKKQGCHFETSSDTEVLL